MANTRIIVFGATGRCGLEILERGIREGYDITAYVRTPSKLPDRLRNNVKVVQGDVYDKEQVEYAIKGHDVVLSSMGLPRQHKVQRLMTEGIRNIVSGMKKHTVKKLVVLSGSQSLPDYWVLSIIKEATEDHIRMLKILQEEKEDIDWVTLHPMVLSESSKVNPGYVLSKNVVSGQLFATTGEIADFMMRFIQEKKIFDEYQHCYVGLSSGPARITTFQMKVLAATIVLSFAALILYYLNLI